MKKQEDGHAPHNETRGQRKFIIKAELASRARDDLPDWPRVSLADAIMFAFYHVWIEDSQDERISTEKLEALSRPGGILYGLDTNQKEVERAFLKDLNVAALMGRVQFYGHKTYNIAATGKAPLSSDVEPVPVAYFAHDRYFDTEDNRIGYDDYGHLDVIIAHGAAAMSAAGVYEWEDVQVERLGFLAWLSPWSKSDRTAGTTSVGDKAAKDRGGRPRKYPWEDMAAEIVRIAGSPDGLPEKHLLNKTMINWCSDNWSDLAEGGPAESEVRRHVAKFTREYYARQ